VCEYTEVPLVRYRSNFSKIFIDLEVGYVVFIVNACVGA
jgi:hypothetical protein